MVPSDVVKRLATANGNIQTDKVLPTYIGSLDMSVKPFILSDCPDVLSMGRLIEESGYELHWKPGHCMWKNPQRNVYQLPLEHYVPMLQDDKSDMHAVELNFGIDFLCQPCVPAGATGPSSSGEIVGLGGGLTGPEAVDDTGGGNASDVLPVEGAEPDPPGDADAEPEMDQTRAERLRLEANSVTHLMTHLPFNPMCIYCRDAKLRAAAAKRKDPALSRRPENFGDVTYIDHTVLNEEEKGDED